MNVRQIRSCVMALMSVSVLSLFAETVVAPTRGVSQAVSSSTIELDAPDRASVHIESTALDYFTSEKIGLTFVVR